MTGKLIILAFLWIAYCSVHSLLIADSVKERAEAILKGGFRYYRVFFNLLSTVMLVPIVLYSLGIDSRPIFRYRGFWDLIQVLLLTAGIALFYLGAKAYDMKEFLGLRQIQESDHEGDGNFSTGGILGFVRHPWYLAGIMVIWGRDLGARELTTNVILTGYFIVGSYLEERKLIRIFGDRYREYQGEVSMLLPIRWVKKKLRG